MGVSRQIGHIVQIIEYEQPRMHLYCNTINITAESYNVYENSLGNNFFISKG